MTLLTMLPLLLTEDPPTMKDKRGDGDASSDGEAYSAPAKRRRQRVLIDDDEED